MANSAMNMNDGGREATLNRRASAASAASVTGPLARRGTLRSHRLLNVEAEHRKNRARASARADALKREAVARFQRAGREARRTKQIRAELLMARMNAGFQSGQVFAGSNSPAVAGARKAFARWRGKALRPDRKQAMLDAVRQAYGSLHSLAKALGLSGATALLQSQLVDFALDYYARHRDTLVRDKLRWYASRLVASKCVSLAKSSPMGLVLRVLPQGRKAVDVVNWLVFRGWAKLCELRFLEVLDALVSDYVLRAAEGLMKPMWVRLGPVAAWAIPMMFDLFVKRRLTDLVSKRDPRVAALIDFDRVSMALAKHKAVVSAALLGAQPTLLPVIMDVAEALDPCVLQVLLVSGAKWTTTTVSPECETRIEERAKARAQRQKKASELAMNTVSYAMDTMQAVRRMTGT